MKESTEMSGRLTLQRVDRHGHIIHEQQHKNRIVKSGRLLVAQLFGGVTTGLPPAQVTHLGVGTDRTEPDDKQEKLFAERDPRKAIKGIDYSDFDDRDPQTGERVQRVRVLLIAEYDFDEAVDTVPLQEAAIFNAERGGVMYNRVIFDPVIKTNAFKLTLQWEILF